MKTRTTTRLVPLAMLAAVSGFIGTELSAQASSSGAGPERRMDSTTVAAQDIAGTWEGSFRLDSAWRLPQRTTNRSSSGRLRFNPVGDATPATRSGRSVHAGTFLIDFRRFGFELSTRDALGWMVGSDSVHAVLNPTVDHGLVELRGVLRTDTLAGTWRYVSDPGGATGTFALTRRGVGDGDTVSRSP